MSLARYRIEGLSQQKIGPEHLGTIRTLGQIVDFLGQGAQPISRNGDLPHPGDRRRTLCGPDGAAPGGGILFALSGDVGTSCKALGASRGFFLDDR